jgi:NADH dehydrogenase
LLYHGITVSYKTSVKEIVAKGVYLLDETNQEYFVDADLVLFTAGSEQSPLIKALSLTKNKIGKIRVKPSLQSLDYEDVFALGDCAAIEDMSLPATAQVALQQSYTASANLLKRYRTQQKQAAGEKAVAENLDSFRYIPLGEMLTLGTLDAAITSLGGWVTLSGPLAAIGRRAVYAVRMPTTSQAIKSLVTAGAVTTGKLWKDMFGNKDE